jgi:hypothetical protein
MDQPGQSERRRGRPARAAWHPCPVDLPRPDPAPRASARLRGPAPRLLLLALAFAGGLLADAAGPGRRIDLLSPPFLAVLAWNLGVYGALVGNALRRRAPDPARRRRGLDVERLLHAGAAALALGLCLGLYARGLVFDYRAGWQSTFLEPAQVHALLSVLLAPAALLTGIAVPDVDGIAALRIAAGGSASGPAAGWIHLFAATLVLGVVLPRIALALHAGWLARRIDAAAASSPAPGAATGGAAAARVVPHALPAVDAARLARALGTAVELAPHVAFGDERAAPVPGGAGPLHVLVPLAATPEAEHHGALLERLRACAPALLVDESAYAARFAHDPPRLDERRAAWRDFAAGHGAAVRFVDLGAA